MSKINIGRAVNNILPRTTAYTPLVEVIVNAIESIQEAERGSDGQVHIRVLRSKQRDVEARLHSVEGFEITDNGVGFNDVHLDAFDTLYTDQKINQGGRGFGRFVCIKHFQHFTVESIYRANDDRLMCRQFSMGRNTEIIENLKTDETDRDDTGTTIRLHTWIGSTSFDLRLDTIAKVLVPRILPFFVHENFSPPQIILSEIDGGETIILNEYLKFIKEIEPGGHDFELPQQAPRENFKVRIFKIYNPRTLTNQISLIAHHREVIETPIKKYIPEFEDAFYEPTDPDTKYIVKAYVFGDYLDQNVSVERGGFEFGNDLNLFELIGKEDIEKQVAEFARIAIGDEFETRKSKKRERAQKYVDSDAIWLKNVLAESDLTHLPLNASDEQIEEYLHGEKLVQERHIRDEVIKVLTNGNLSNIDLNVTKIVDQASQTSKDNLVRYVAFRRSILELIQKSLEKDEHGDYLHEGAVHDIIFPRGKDSDSTPFDSHNLWLIDERLNFSNFVTSDKQLGGGNLGRPDLLIYDNRVLFRGDETESNPITVIEFKRPMLDDFTRRNSSGNPIDQLIGYVIDIRRGKYSTPSGRPCKVNENTPAYGYIVCDITPRIVEWLTFERSFTPMPDGLGWFSWAQGPKLYIEVMSWDKVIKDALIRNKVFFKKLGV
ncbi:MAG: ATP-binding protein [Bacteroidetes bacterium]|nr:ATP-binding protein [Bacteroidota bacterium]